MRAAVLQADQSSIQVREMSHLQWWRGQIPQRAESYGDLESVARQDRTTAWRQVAVPQARTLLPSKISQSGIARK